MATFKGFAVSAVLNNGKKAWMLIDQGYPWFCEVDSVLYGRGIYQRALFDKEELAQAQIDFVREHWSHMDGDYVDSGRLVRPCHSSLAIRPIFST
jgi:hypothetical protein